jgi:hypothetical protein
MKEAMDKDHKEHHWEEEIATIRLPAKQETHEEIKEACRVRDLADLNKELIKDL